MDEIYKMALDGTLKSNNKSGEDFDVTFQNDLPTRLCYEKVGCNGDRRGFGTIHADSTKKKKSQKGEYWVFTTYYSSAFVCVILVDDERTYAIDESLLVVPNDIGYPPKPTRESMIPVNSQAILIGIAEDTTTFDSPKILMREQSWDKASASYTLSPGENKEIYTQSVRGIDESSSETKSSSSSFSASVSGGYGAISASASASLSKNSTSTHAVSLSTQEIAQATRTFKGADDAGSIIILWQLTEQLTWYQHPNSHGIKHTITTKSVPIVPSVLIITSENPSLIIKDVSINTGGGE